MRDITRTFSLKYQYPFFASIFPLFPQKRLILRLKRSQYKGVLLGGGGGEAKTFQSGCEKLREEHLIYCQVNEPVVLIGLNGTA